MICNHKCIPKLKPGDVIHFLDGKKLYIGTFIRTEVQEYCMVMNHDNCLRPIVSTDSSKIFPLWGSDKIVKIIKNPNDLHLF